MYAYVIPDLEILQRSTKVPIICYQLLLTGLCCWRKMSMSWTFLFVFITHFPHLPHLTHLSFLHLSRSCFFYTSKRFFIFFSNGELPRMHKILNQVVNGVFTKHLRPKSQLVYTKTTSESCFAFAIKSDLKGLMKVNIWFFWLCISIKTNNSI